MSGGRGARKPPLTFEGDYDATRTYLPREVVRYGTTAYMATAKVTGVLPTVAASWLPLGGGGVADGLLGFAQVQVSFSAASVSDGTTNTGTSGLYLISRGAPAISISAAGAISDAPLAAAGAPEIYTVVARLSISGTTNLLTSDISAFKLFNVPGLNAGGVKLVDALRGTGAVVPGGDLVAAGVGEYRLAPNGPQVPKVVVGCTGGTDRTYTFNLNVFYWRWAAPPSNGGSDGSIFF